MCIFSVCLGFQSFVNKGSLTDCINKTVSDFLVAPDSEILETLYVWGKFFFLKFWVWLPRLQKS